MLAYKAQTLKAFRKKAEYQAQTKIIFEGTF
jgi:hypothetical protein